MIKLSIIGSSRLVIITGNRMWSLVDNGDIDNARRGYDDWSLKTRLPWWFDYKRAVKQDVISGLPR